MFKKQILVLLSTSLILTSCGKAELGTFEEEMASQVNSYTASINSYFEKSEKIDLQGSGKSTGKINFSSPQYGKGTLNIDMDQKMAFDTAALFGMNYAGDYSIDGNVSISGDMIKDDPYLSEFDGVKAEGKLAFAIGMIGDSFYGNLKEISANVSSSNSDKKEEIEQLNSMIKSGLEVSKIYTKKWYSLAFTEEMKELMGEVEMPTITQETLKKYSSSSKDILNIAISILGKDIYKDIEKTQYEGKDAYKFSFDYDKLAVEGPVVVEEMMKKYIDMGIISFDDLGISQEDWDSEVELMKEDMKDSILSLKDMESSTKTEFYLVKTAKDHSDLIFKFEENSENPSGKIVFSILKDEIKFEANMDDGYEKTTAVLFAKLSGKTVKYGLDLDIKESKGTGIGKIKLDGDYKFDFGSKDLSEKLTGKLTVDVNNPEVVKVEADYTFDSSFKSDKNLKLTEQSLTSGEDVVDFATILEGVMGGLGGYDNSGYDYDYLNYNLGDYDFSDTELEDDLIVEEE